VWPKVLACAWLTLAVAHSQERAELLGRRFQKFEIQFQLDPPDAQLSVGGVVLPALAGRPGAYILQPSQVGMLDPESKVDFVFERHGYASQSLKLNQSELKTGEQRQVQLKPNSLPGYWREYPALFIGLGLVLASAGMEGVRRHLLARRLEQRHRKLQLFDQKGSQQFDALIRAQVGRFRIVERLGSGGMASVYRALPDENLERQEQVAIKCIRPDQLTASFVERRPIWLQLWSIGQTRA
jgi:hypothetical protein